MDNTKRPKLTATAGFRITERTRARADQYRAARGLPEISDAYREIVDHGLSAIEAGAASTGAGNAELHAKIDQAVSLRPSLIAEIDQLIRSSMRVEEVVA